MIFLCKQEADADGAKEIRTFFRLQIDVDTEGFQTVCSTTFGRCGTVSVLGYLDTACGNDHGRGGGNVKAVCAVTAGSHNFQYFSVVFYL